MALRIISASILLVTVCCLLITPTKGLTKVTEQNLKDSAGFIRDDLVNVMKKVTKYDVLQKKYETKNFDIASQNGNNIVSNMKQKLEEILQNKIQTILTLATDAEKLMHNYTWEDDLTLENLEPYTFIDSKFLESSGNISLREEVSFSTSIKVNLTYSTVHIPTDVYNGSEVIVNSIKWTKGLDETFRKNLAREPSLLWQYFGTSTGVYRVYPGYKWLEANSKDFFDHRRRGWYIQGSSSPKNMVILLDLSGSMVGNKLAISKLSATFLLDTLQENDFVNIVTFNNVSRMLCEETEVADKFPANCSHNLLQATKQNIQYLKDMVNLVNAREMANVSGGFARAMQVLQTAHENNNQSGAGCIRTINFFSDGVEDDEHKKTLATLEKLKAKEEKIRIFGYLVGREKGSKYKPIENIACKYRGFFYTIETLSDVRENVTRYLSVMGRPQGLLTGNDRPVSWTPIYLDNGGLGLMITVVAPVYDPKHKEKLLGVVGTDVALPELKSSIPAAEVGVNGFGFSINNNGFLVIHPTLKDDSDGVESAKQNENPPHSTLEDINLEKFKEDLENLSHSLIDRKTGSTSFKMRVFSKDKKRVSAVRTYNFFYTDINGTSFSSAIAMTDDGCNYFSKIDYTNSEFAKGKSFDKVLGYLNSGDAQETVNVSPWNICHGIIPDKRSSTPLYKPIYASASDLQRNLTDKDEAYKLCKKELLDQLLYGAFTTQNLGWNLEVNDTNGFLSVFVGTNGGLSRVLAPGQSDSPIGADVTNEPFYQQASDFEDAVVVSTNPKHKGSSSKADSVITAAYPIYAEKNSKKVLAAVAGMQMKDSTLQEIMLNKSKSCKEDNDTYSCYLIDEDGFVVSSSSSNSKVDVGKHFSAVHYPVFDQMVKDGLYEVLIYKDSNHKCPEGFGVKASSAMRLLNPLLAVSSYAVWITQTLFWSLVQFNLYSFFSSKTQVFAETASDQTYCTAEIKYYKAIKMNQATYIKSEKCNKDKCLGPFYVAPVKASNLRFVIVENCGCEANEKAKWLKNLEVESTFIAPTPRYRKLPQLKCYAYSDKEKKLCSSGCDLSPLKLLLIGLPLIYLLLAQ